MCGIAGVIGSEGQAAGREIYEEMLARLTPRGPDQQGAYAEGEAVLLHRRLAVIDIEKGRQPMTYRRGQEEYCIVYNGELYNTAELRCELIARGYAFHGHCDTEVLLKAYTEWGKDCLEKLNGIYAFAVWEKHKQRLFFARDRMGVKPLFYARRGEVFVFASEIKAVLAHPLVRPEIDKEGVAEILLIGPGRTPGFGVFKDIFELPPAHYGYYSDRRLEICRYWQLKDRENRDSLPEAAEKVRWLVRDAIKRQLVSDVPLCAFLSGGLDSGIITAIAAEHLNKQGKEFRTFSVNYSDNDKYFRQSRFQPDSDANYIRRMNSFVHVPHTEIVIDTPALVDALYEAVEARDLPGMADVDASLLLFCREVKKEATVAVSGECADEIFGGYPWYTDEKSRAEEGFPWSRSGAYRRGFLRDEIAAVLGEGDYAMERCRATVKDTDKLPGLSPLESRMKELVRLNTDWFMQTLLDRKDRMSMYSGLEVRVPFCDHRIAEYMYSVPWTYKYWQEREKGLLRFAFCDLLPWEIVWRKKSPYPKTHNPSYLKAVRERLSDVIADPLTPLWQIVKKSELERLLAGAGETNEPWYGQLMTEPQTIAYFLQLDYWLKKYHISIV